MKIHKPDQTKININGFDMAKSAAQLLYGPVIVYTLSKSAHVRTWKDTIPLGQSLLQEALNPPISCQGNHL